MQLEHIQNAEIRKGMQFKGETISQVIVYWKKSSGLIELMNVCHAVLYGRRRFTEYSGALKDQ